MLFPLWNFNVNLTFFCKYHEFDQNWKKGDNLNINCRKTIKFTLYHTDTDKFVRNHKYHKNRQFSRPRGCKYVGRKYKLLRFLHKI